MIYFQNYARGHVGFNNHLVSYILCISLSNFLDRDFFFDYELPSTSPPDFASVDDFRKKFSILTTSPRSLVSDLIRIPSRRQDEIVDRNDVTRIEMNDFLGTFLTTEALQDQFENTLVWDHFSLGREAVTREFLSEYRLIEVGELSLANPTFFYFLDKAEKTALLESIRIIYLDGLEELADRIRTDVGRYYAIHIRLGDFLTYFGAEGHSLEIEDFRRALPLIFTEPTLPILIATDGLQEKELFKSLFADYRYLFIDELIFDEHLDEYRNLEFTDFNALSVINQLLCAGAENFIGTFYSTFTTIIHRLRQERYRKTDFHFVPVKKVRGYLNPALEFKTDAAGFFAWNKHSVFSEHPSLAAWAREWEYEKTSIIGESDPLP